LQIGQQHTFRQNIHGSANLREARIERFDNSVKRKECVFLDQREEEDGEMYIKRNLIICILYQILLGQSTQSGSDYRKMVEMRIAYTILVRKVPY
jgi:hypothetical protein